MLVNSCENSCYIFTKIQHQMESSFHLQSISKDDWQQELKKTALKYHQVGAWVAVIFNLLFSLNDFLNVREHWFIFFVVRFSVSLITFLVLILRKKLKISNELLIFVPFFLISVQNAFMWSYMDTVHFFMHALAYIALFIGAGMLILWEIQYSVIIVVLSILSNILFLTLFSHLTIKDVMLNGGLLTTVVSIFSIILIQTRYNLNKKEIISRLALHRSNQILNRQKLIIQEKTDKIESSIRYAKRIQEAILPTQEILDEITPESFIYYKAKDIVSGDFYWFGKLENKSIIAAVDCTGHGVPGAFMSMIGNTILNKLIFENKYSEPAQILFELRKEVIQTLSSSNQKDGMDIALCTIDIEKMKLEFSGAHNSLYIVRDKELTELKANRMPIGKYFNTDKMEFYNHEFDLQESDMLYLFTDGYTDQFGKETDRKFTKKRLKELLVSIAHLPVEKQEKNIAEVMGNWKQDLEQLDDMLLIGIRI